MLFRGLPRYPAKSPDTSKLAGKEMCRLAFTIICALLSIHTYGASCSPRHPERFSEFLTRFSADKEYAATRTVFPLRVLVWEYGADANGQDMSRVKQSRISRTQYLKSPSLAEHMEENELTSMVKRQTKTVAVLEVFKDSSDWLVSLHFRLQKGCWFLWKEEDQSL